MATFNQQGQTVHGNQFNAENITNNFGHIKNNTEFLEELKNIIGLINQLENKKEISKETAEGVNGVIKKAIIQVGKPEPDQGAIIKYLNKAKDLVSGVSGLTTAIGAAITAIGLVF